MAAHWRVSVAHCNARWVGVTAVDDRTYMYYYGMYARLTEQCTNSTVDANVKSFRLPK